MDKTQVMVLMVGILLMLVAIVFGYVAARELGHRRRVEPSSETEDWRHPYLVLGVLLLVAGTLMVLFARG